MRSQLEVERTTGDGCRPLLAELRAERQALTYRVILRLPLRRKALWYGNCVWHIALSGRIVRCGIA